MAAAKEPITAEMFKEATGYDHDQDDLERCNCPEVNAPGHHYCGWNYRVNLPMFINDREEPALIVRDKKSGSGRVFDKATQADEAQRYLEQELRRGADVELTDY